MNDTHTVEYLVRHSEADRAGKLKLRAIADYFQEGAAQHAEKLGCGLEYLKQTGKFWVLSRLRIRFFRRPGIGEKLTLLTYPRGAEQGLFARREYRLHDAKGEDIAHASSYWLLLSLPRLRPERMASLQETLPNNSEKAIAFESLERAPLPAAPVELGTRIVYESGIDVNAHLNNAAYFDFAADALQSLAPEREVAEIQINFLRALAKDDAIRLEGESSAEAFNIAGILPSETSFQVFGLFRPENT